MTDNLSTIYPNSATDLVFRPLFFRLALADDKKALDTLIFDGKILHTHNEIYTQLQELIKSMYPAERITPDRYSQLIEAHLNGTPADEYGVWVYYPWNGRLVHLLDEEEFVEVRTNRNRLKITRSEQRLLKQKKIGVVGLSVGQSIALTLAMERTCGELRLADFDTAELSNLNRLRTGVHNMGIKKTVIAAREIAEIDPYIHVKLYHDGLTKENMDDFFTADGKLDLFIEVCDGMDIKIESRFKARELQIPVVMDTNDRGMLDVERFDLEPERPILHGLADGLDPDNIKDLSNEDKIPYILKMVGAETISTRLKASMMEVQQSINTWPQLASSVVLGGALTTDVCRRILLDQFRSSGRYYVDLDELVKDEEILSTEVDPSYIGPPELTEEDMLKAAEQIEGSTEGITLDQNIATQIAQAGVIAPSGGNAQPWKLLYTDKGLLVFHDAHHSHSFLDFEHLGSYVAIGALVENVAIKASTFGLNIKTEYFPLQGDRTLAARVIFTEASSAAYEPALEKGLNIRVTNRDKVEKERLAPPVADQLISVTEAYDGAKLQLITDDQLMKQVGDLAARAEMMRILHPRGHYDTFTNELRWSTEEAERTLNGLDVNTLGASKGEIAALGVAKDAKAIAFLREQQGGIAFTKMVNNAIAYSSAIGIVTMPQYSAEDFVKGGRAVERLWIEANLAGLSFQPVAQLVFMTARTTYDAPATTEQEKLYHAEVSQLQQQLHALLPQIGEQQPVFMFRLAKGGQPKARSLRRPLSATFSYKV
ncbi:Rv1355c family protein [Mucilaginibacter daejeonensis]|uniref:Rv1355c family protein n=1 Tax=Mucilaginibacter daejeonensis TaxID=398049 RepID=UPI001D178DAE|nr:Rv1355c family protein [Mucilaginibacter daejeonensis]UEG55071.1 Rv1355c family protein [Mucilaginibacter daejeonensis]